MINVINDLRTIGAHFSLHVEELGGMPAFQTYKSLRYLLRLVLSQKLLEVQAKRVRSRRAHFAHALHIVRVRAREAGAGHCSVRVRVRQHYRLVALRLRRWIWI